MDSPERLVVYSAAPTPTGFYSQELQGFIFPVLEPLVWPGAGMLGWLAPQVSFPLFVFRGGGEGREKERERNIGVWLLLTCSPLGTWPATQACALTGN